MHKSKFRCSLLFIVICGGVSSLLRMLMDHLLLIYRSVRLHLASSSAGFTLTWHFLNKHMLEYESDTQALASTCMSVCKVCHSGHHLVLLHKLRAFAAVQCLAAVGFMKPIIGTKHLESCFKLTM